MQPRVPSGEYATPAGPEPSSPRFTQDRPPSRIPVCEPHVESTLPSHHVPGRAVVIGGGVAGSAAASALRARGASVTVYDKGRGPGGRVSTRRDDSLSSRGADILSFDHGTPSFAARALPFVDAVGAWAQAGVAQRWVGRFAEFDGRMLRPLPSRNLWVGLPGMSRIVAHQQAGLDVRFGVRVVSMHRGADGWHIRAEDGTASGPFDHAVVAIPAPQAVELLAPVADTVAREVFAVPFAPCWALMLAFDTCPGLPFDCLTLRSGSTLAGLACDSTKPGRGCDLPERWVAHASTAWSIGHINTDPEAAAGHLLDTFQEICRTLGRTLPDPSFRRAHLWRFARVVEPLGRPCLHDAGRSLTVCGDWCLGSTVEDAWLSGTAAARALAPKDAG